MYEHALEHDLVPGISVIRDNYRHLAQLIVPDHPRVDSGMCSIERRY